MEQIKLAIEKTKTGKRGKAGSAVLKHVTPATAAHREVMEQKSVPIYEPNPEILKMALGDEPRITHRPADDIPDDLAKYREEMKEYLEQEEDVLSYALFPPVATEFFKYRRAQKYGMDASLYNEKDKVHPV